MNNMNNMNMGDKCRERILQMAWELFNYHGFKNVTISDLARSLGSSKSTVYKYFSSKEQIAEEMFMLFNDKFMEYSRTLKESGVGPLERLQKLIDFFKNHINQINPLFIEDINKYAPVLAKRLREIHENKVYNIEAIIKEGQELGVITELDSRMAAFVFANLVVKTVGKQDNSLIQYGYSAVEVSDFLSKMILSGIKTGG